MAQVRAASNRGPFGKPVRIAGGVLLPLSQPLGELTDLGRAARFGDQQTGGRARPPPRGPAHAPPPRLARHAAGPAWGAVGEPRPSGRARAPPGRARKT